jgi:hypothetical protein
MATSSGARFSPCGNYRYELWRRWSDGPELIWILLNPSTADARRDDPTIRKCIGFSRLWGYGGMRVLNLFAFRATRPAALRRAADPVGPNNNRTLRKYAARECIIAWGNHGDFRDRAAPVISLLHGPVFTLGLTASGQPKHPGRLSYETSRVLLGGTCLQVPHRENPPSAKIVRS